ncbi:uncharacterized protein M6D78_015820 [Vipera latastei]
MKSWLFALGLALCCVVQAEWKEVTTVSKKDMVRWVIHIIACDSPSHLEQLRDMPAFVVELTQPEEDVFSISALIPMPDGCKNVTHQIKRGEDGKYHGFFDGTTVTVLSAKVQGDYVITVISVNKEFRITTLQSRKEKLDPKIVPKFEDECKKLGYTAEEILLLNQTVKCQ